jgi:ribonuclease BN (tRNA processing enzyme)
MCGVDRLAAESTECHCAHDTHQWSSQEVRPGGTDDNVAVTATLVSHYDVHPAFGFRFDLAKSGVSVTFSGDTTKSHNLIALTRDLDDAYFAL